MSPMGIYVQINAFYNQSTGSIMRKNAKIMDSEGWKSFCFWGRGKKTQSAQQVRFTSRYSVYTHAVLARLTDRAGFYSKHDTRYLISMLDAIDPDIVHLHGLQGYYINIPILFNWLSKARCQVWITLHDCWLFTGHCPHFSYVGCSKWVTGCHDCPLIHEYPKSLFRDSSEQNYNDKKYYTHLLNPNKVKIICPSSWMESLVKQSFLSGFKTEVHHNEIDHDVFHHIDSNIKSILKVPEKNKIALGVASPWTCKKGLNDFYALRNKLSDKWSIVLVGLNRRQIRSLPGGIIGIPRINEPLELVKLYSAADYFINLTYEDTFPTVNLEAQACGTPVVTYDTGGCRETLSLDRSAFFPTGQLDSIAFFLNQLAK